MSNSFACRATCLVAFGVMLIAGCKEKTGQLAADQLARFEKEGIAHRADDLTFRRTNVGESEGGWEDKKASIIVTSESVLLHVNGKSLVEITPRSTGVYEVHRDHDRVSLRAGSGKSAASWSFRPPDNAEGWTDDIRAVIRNSRSRANPASEKGGDSGTKVKP